MSKIITRIAKNNLRSVLRLLDPSVTVNLFALSMLLTLMSSLEKLQEKVWNSEKYKRRKKSFEAKSEENQKHS